MLVIAVIVMAIIFSTAYAQQRDVSKEAYLDRCDNILNDDRGQWHEFGCIYFPEIWNLLSELFSTTLELEISMNNTQNRLDILHGKINAEPLPLTLNITPDSIIQGEKFRVYGTANVYELDGVGFHIINPNGTTIQHEDSDLGLDNHYASLPITPNKNWVMEGNYTIEAYHNNENVTKIIQYTLGIQS